jgi:hypothetical protein
MSGQRHRGGGGGTRLAIAAGAVLGVSGVIGLVIHLLGSRREPDVPSVEIARSLDADRTVLLAALEVDRVNEVIAPFLTSLASQLGDGPFRIHGPAEGDAVLKTLVAPARRRVALGFDPTEREEWTRIGLAPDLRAAIAVQDRGPQPDVALRVTDRARALTWLDGIGAGPKVDRVGACERLQLGRKSFLTGTVGQDTLLTAAAEKAEAACPRVLAIARPVTRPLSEDATFRSAVRGLSSGQGRALVYLALGPLARLVSKHPGPAGDMFRHYQALFPALGAQASRAGLLLSLVATQHGYERLSRIFRGGTPPQWRRFVPSAGWAALHLALDLSNAAEDAGSLLPPFLGPRLIADARDALCARFDVRWPDIAEAFEGQVLVAANLTPLTRERGGGTWMSSQSMLIIAKERDGARAAELFARLEKALTKSKPLQIGTARGFADRDGLAAARMDGFLFVATNRRLLEDALGRDPADSLASIETARSLEDETTWSLYLDPDTLKKALQLATATRDPALATFFAAAEIRDPVALWVRLEADRLVVGADHRFAPSMSTISYVVGTLAVHAIPAFLRTIREAERQGAVP